MIELAKKEGITCLEEEISERQLTQADEIWLTSSTREVMPVIELNRQTVGEGKPGELWQKVSNCYTAYKNQLRLAQ